MKTVKIMKVCADNRAIHIFRYLLGWLPRMTITVERNTKCSDYSQNDELDRSTQAGETYASELVQKHMGLVARECKRIARSLPAYIRFEDLISAGTVGLIEAAEKYDCKYGVPFSSYCLARIRGAVRDELRGVDWRPRSVREKAKSIDEAKTYLWSRLQRAPTMSELAEQLNVDHDQVMSMLSSCERGNIVSIFQSQHGGVPNSQLVNSIADTSTPSPVERLKRKDFLRTVTKGLSQKERLIVILYYFEELTMKEVGDALGIGLSRVSAMHQEIIARLRDKLKFDTN